MNFIQGFKAYQISNNFCKVKIEEETVNLNLCDDEIGEAEKSHDLPPKYEDIYLYQIVKIYDSRSDTPPPSYSTLINQS